MIMKPIKKCSNNFPVIRRMAGVGLLEVVLAIAIFAFGMLALVQLQGNVTRSSADANLRTGAINIAEELVETVRAFEKVEVIEGNGRWEYLELQGNALNGTEERGNINYAVEVTITDYWWDQANDTFIPTQDGAPPAGSSLAYSDFKLLQLDVSWDNIQEYSVDDETTANLGTGSITLYEIVPSTPSILGARVVAEADPDEGLPVRYAPGARPDYIPVNLGNDTLKESRTPAPTQESTDRTWFEVFTYNTAGDVLRREQFLIAKCECTLKQKPAGVGVGGLLPTIWNGRDYVTGPVSESDGSNFSERDNFVNKQYGESTANLPPGFTDYCKTCCRDHHDDPAFSNADEVYDPARLSDPDAAWTEADDSGNHVHYSATGQGKNVGLTPVNVNGVYVEACRLVRKDGFMRVAQDFRQEGFLAFPQGFLNTRPQAEAYSGYVVDAVTDFYENDRDSLTGPDGIVAIPGTETNPTSLPFPGEGGVDNQQLRSRAIYIDHLSAEASRVVACLNPNVDAVGPCDDVTGSQSWLEAYPFFEVQTTWLSDWVENSNGDLVTITADVLTEDEVVDVDLDPESSKSRGKVTLAKTATTGTAVATSMMARGNIGLVLADEISPREKFDSSKHKADVTINVNPESEPESNGISNIWNGKFKSGTNKADAQGSDLIYDIDTTYCLRNGENISCMTPVGVSGSIEITIDYRGNASTSLYVCTTNLPGASVDNSAASAAVKTAVVSWNITGNVSESVALTIEEDECAVQ